MVPVAVGPSCGAIMNSSPRPMLVMQANSHSATPIRELEGFIYSFISSLKRQQNRVLNVRRELIRAGRGRVVIPLKQDCRRTQICEEFGICAPVELDWIHACKVDDVLLYAQVGTTVDRNAETRGHRGRQKRI